MTGACGPYNLGGSATDWYQSDHYKDFCSIVLPKLQNDLGQINLTVNLVQIASDLSYFILAIPYLINKALYGGVVILLCPI